MTNSQNKKTTTINSGDIELAQVLGRFVDLLESQEKQARHFYWYASLSVLSLIVSGVVGWQIFEYRAERRQDTVLRRQETTTRIAYESATQNVINRYMGQNEGRAQAILEFRNEVAKEAEKKMKEMENEF